MSQETEYDCFVGVRFDTKNDAWIVTREPADLYDDGNQHQFIPDQRLHTETMGDNTCRAIEQGLLNCATRLNQGKEIYLFEYDMCMAKAFAINQSDPDWRPWRVTQTMLSAGRDGKVAENDPYGSRVHQSERAARGGRMDAAGNRVDAMRGEGLAANTGAVGIAAGAPGFVISGTDSVSGKKGWFWVGDDGEEHVALDIERAQVYSSLKAAEDDLPSANYLLDHAEIEPAPSVEISALGGKASNAGIAASDQSLGL